MTDGQVPFAFWNSLATDISIFSWSAGLLLLFIYVIRLLLISDLKKKYDFIIKAPVLRISENIGFNNPKGTNTKSKRPNWYKGNMIELKSISKENFWVSRILLIIDRITIAGIRSQKCKKVTKKNSKNMQ